MFESLIDRITTKGELTNTQVTTATLRRLKEFSETISELRIFVANAEGLGHQASSLLVLKRMIAFGFTMPALVVYENEAVLGKLQILIPQLDPAKPTQTLELNGVQVTFRSEDDVKKKPPAWQPLGVTGGFDAVDNLTERLRVEYYLLLQPLLWEPDNNILFDRKGSKTKLKDVKELDRIGLRGFYQPVPQYDDEAWTQARQVPRFAAQMALARVLQAEFRGLKPSPLNLLTAYGLANAPGGRQTLSGTPANMLFNLVGAVTHLQDLTRDEGATVANPCVIVVFQALKGSSWDYWAAVEQLLQGDENVTNAKLREYLTKHGVKDRVLLLKDAAEDTLKEKLQELKSPQSGKTVLLLSIPGVPQDVFNDLYLWSSLPFVLEGQNTANLAINLGKPYVHLAKSGVVPYPFQFTGLTATANKLAEAAFELQRNPKFFGSTPLETIGQLFADFSDPRPQPLPTEFRKFLRATRDFYHDERNDKLLMALGYLMTQLPPKQELLSLPRELRLTRNEKAASRG